MRRLYLVLSASFLLGGAIGCRSDCCCDTGCDGCDSCGGAIAAAPIHPTPAPHTIPAPMPVADDKK